MMPVGPRTHGGASLRVAVPVSLPMRLRARIREVVGIRSVNTGKGDADCLLTQTCMEADRTATALFLHVEPSDGVDKARLTNWYQSHGFGAVQAEPLLMTRMPA